MPLQRGLGGPKAILGTCMKGSFVHHNLFYEQWTHFALARVPMGHCCSKLGGLGQRSQGEAFLVDRGFFVKTCHFCQFLQIMKTSSPVHNSVLNSVHNSKLVL